MAIGDNLFYKANNGGAISRTGISGEYSGSYQTANVDPGDVVTLVAHPDPNYVVDDWLIYDYGTTNRVSFPGLVTSGATSINFVMPSDKSLLIQLNFAYVPPDSFCLTTSVAAGQGTIQQPGCSWGEKGPSTSESCAQDFAVGETISLKANPYDGWEVEKWVSSPSGLFSGDMAGETTVSVVMPSNDVDVTVYFSHPDVALSLSVPYGNGCVEIQSPAGHTIPCNGGVITLPAEEVRIAAVPDPGWEVAWWSLDGVTAGSELSIDFPLYGYSSRTVQVAFQEISCDKNTLTVTISGQGSVSPGGGEYCDDTTVSLNPVPAFGYFFRDWEYGSQSGITRSGVTLLVDMSFDRSVTAIFEPYPTSTPGTPGSEGLFGEGGIFEVPTSTVFYCPSETYHDSVVSFNFTNNWENPSQFETFHFRVNFYADANRTQLVYSAFSHADTKRWFYNDSYFSPIPLEGVEVGMGETMNIIYDPEILPSHLTEEQRNKTINSDGIYERPLVCGVKYYVDAQVYNSVDASITFLETIALILNCDDVDSYLWDYNKDANKWLCSGQGKTDLQVTDSSAQSVFSNVSSNIFGMFQIVWQSRRENANPIYSAVWDSEKDILYSSGQGMFDKIRIDDGDNPIVLTDHAGNFFITSNTKDSFATYACPFPVGIDDAPIETIDSSFGKFCYPGLTTNLGTSYDEVSMRVYSEDVESSLTINKDKAVSVVNKQLIRLDVEGISGAYAVRLRNINDDEWGGWINVGNDLYENEADGISLSAEDVLYDAYRIDNDRFIVPWSIDKVNGLRRICCQVLTLYGITRTFCMDVFVNFEAMQYVFKFYFKKTGDGTSAVFEDDDMFPTYKGQYVLSLKDNFGNLTTDSSSTIYFTTIFAEDVSYDDREIKFNVIQQGVNNIWGQPLRKIGNRTFYGEFSIYSEDKIFNKDGKAFIELVFPDSSQATGCLSDTLDSTSDPYNLMISDEEALQTKDLSPEEVYENRKMNTISKVQDIEKFKQYYDQDDNNFKFGDPLYFRDK